MYTYDVHSTMYLYLVYIQGYLLVPGRQCCYLVHRTDAVCTLLYVHMHSRATYAYRWYIVQGCAGGIHVQVELLCTSTSYIVHVRCTYVHEYTMYDHGTMYDVYKVRVHITALPVILLSTLYKYIVALV